jgi:hypothetical protein
LIFDFVKVEYYKLRLSPFVAAKHFLRKLSSRIINETKKFGTAEVFGGKCSAATAYWIKCEKNPTRANDPNRPPHPAFHPLGLSRAL